MGPYLKTSVIQFTEIRKTQIVVRNQSNRRHVLNTSSGTLNKLPRISSNSPRQLVDCPICGEITLKQSLYGGFACCSCKSFFRRTVINPAKNAEKCKSGTSNCLLKKERRTNCPYCRFQQCLRYGLNPNLVKKKFKPSKTTRNTLKSESKETICEESHSKISLEIQLSQILQYQKLVLSQTSGINLMTVPNKFINLIHRNIMRAKDDRNVNYDVFSIAEIEHIFLSVKNEFLHKCRDKIEKLKCQGIKCSHPNQNLLNIYELSLEWTMRFMKECKYFEGLSWECKARLLRQVLSDQLLKN